MWSTTARPTASGSRTGHVAEHQHGVDGSIGRAGRPRARAREARRRTGGRDEHERLAEVALAEDARELEQRGGGRELRAAGRPRASRLASTTMRRLERPGRTPTTVSRSASPERRLVRVTSNAPRRVRRSTWPSVEATRSASPASPASPGRRDGKAEASSLSEFRRGRRASPKATKPSKASAASGDVAGGGTVQERERGHERCDQRGQEGGPVDADVEHLVGLRGRVEAHTSTVPAPEASILGLQKVMADRAPRILLVDDEQPIQTLLSFPLQRDGYEVVQAVRRPRGADALLRAGVRPRWCST
jgi:hypothetical protein